MSSENEWIIKLLSECLKEDETIISDLYNLTRPQNGIKTKKNQAKSDILIQIIQAALLLQTVEVQENAFTRESKNIPFHFLKGSIQLALLVSAVEAVGTPREYLNFNQWINKEYFPNKNQDHYSKREINRAWNEYNEHYGSSKSFRDVILNSGLNSLLTKFLLSEAILLLDKNDQTEYPHERVQLKDIENPKDLVSHGIYLHHNGIRFILLYDNSGYFTKELIKRHRERISNLDEIQDYYIFVKDLKRYSEIVQLKHDSIKKYLKLKLIFLYNLRSGYYHTGELQVSKDNNSIMLEPWRYGQKTYFPLIGKSLITLFWEISRQVIISTWKQKLNNFNQPV